MTSFIILMLSSLAMNMFLVNNPLSMGIMILLMALLVSILFSYSMSSWIAFLIFLIYIGGMLVMFSYFVCMLPNQSMNMMYMLMMTFTSFSFLSTISYMLNMKIILPIKFPSQSNMFYLQYNSSSLILMAMILLLTMIIVIKLTLNTKGPLRPFNYIYV